MFCPCIRAAGSLRGGRRVVGLAPVVLRGESSLSSVMLRLVLSLVWYLLGGVRSVLLVDRSLECSRRVWCVVSWWCTMILCDIRG